MSSTRGFTSEEEKYFADSAKKAYDSFTTKAAFSRDMPVEELREYAQGRVWTGRQALNRGLVDHVGGLWKALSLAASMSGIEANKTNYIPVQTLREPKSGPSLPFGTGTSTGSTDPVRLPVFAICEDIITSVNLASPDSLGLTAELTRIGLGPLTAALIRQSSLISEDISTLSSIFLKRIIS